MTRVLAIAALAGVLLSTAACGSSMSCGDAKRAYDEGDITVQEERDRLVAQIEDACDVELDPDI
jgi:hypothetical protein